jgi:hypothetical protein
MSRAPVILHVGLPKTATTFLQQQVFPHLAGVDMPYRDDASLVRAFRDAVQENPLFQDTSMVKMLFAERRKARPDKTLLISDESLIGASDFGFFNCSSIGKALKELFPDAKIFLVIRRQDDFAESLYKEALHQYHSVPLATFLGGDSRQLLPDPPYRRVLDRPYPKADLPTFDWARYVDFYEDLFGPENVLVLPFELLATDLNSFLVRFCDFAGFPRFVPTTRAVSNRSYGALTARIARVLNNFVWTEFRSFGFIPDRPFIRRSPARFRPFIKKISLEAFLVATTGFLPQGRALIDSQTRKKILARFAVGNARIDRARQLGLANFGYY